MLEEALNSGAKMECVLLDEKQQIDKALFHRILDTGAMMCVVPQKLLALVSNVETPQGLVFSCGWPEHELEELKNLRRVLVLDGLQDPGNLGTILRTADAFALDGIILCEGCTDFTSPKVVRATMGAIFRIPVIHLPLSDAVDYLKTRGISVYAAALSQSSVSVTSVTLSHAAVIIGNEGRGVSEEALTLCDKQVIIPMEGCAESLNASVAASILMWEMTRT